MFRFFNYLCLPLLTLLLAFTLSCSPGVKTPLQLESAIFRDFDIIRNKETESYLKNLKLRLLEDQNINVRILVAKSDSVFALSFKSGIILLSTGLISGSKYESELAFIIAHEYAHFDQQHFEDNKDLLDSETIKERELSADDRALEILFESGFSLQGAVNSIKKFNSLHASDSAVKIDLTEQEYASTAERLNNLKKSWIGKICAGSTNCSDSGTLDSREYQKFRSWLETEL